MTAARPQPPDADDDADALLWCEALPALPRPYRTKFLDYVVALSREAADAAHEAARFAAEADRLNAEVERLRPAPSLAERLDARDKTVREALALYDGPPTVRAKKLASDLRRPASDGSAQRRAAATVLRLNGGRALGWRQIQNIAGGYRRE